MRWYPRSYSSSFDDYCDSSSELFEVTMNKTKLGALSEVICPDDSDNLKQNLLDLHTHHKTGKKLYLQWVSNAKGKVRRLSMPNKILRAFFDNYLVKFIKEEKINPNCHGGEKGWSPKKSLQTHMPCKSLLSFDLKSASENISAEYIYTFFYDKIEVSHEIRQDLAGFLTMLCTVDYNRKRGLPIGSSHSMALLNRVLRPLDEILTKKSEEKRFTYSRWVDDMIISSPDINSLESFLGAAALVNEEFPVSPTKLFFQQSPSDLYILGHIIQGETILKNNKKEAKKHKKPLNFEKVLKKDYDLWE